MSTSERTTAEWFRVLNSLIVERWLEPKAELPRSERSPHGAAGGLFTLEDDDPFSPEKDDACYPSERYSALHSLRRSLAERDRGPRTTWTSYAGQRAKALARRSRPSQAYPPSWDDLPPENELLAAGIPDVGPVDLDFLPF